MAQEIIPQPAPSVLMDPDRFDHIKRVAEVFAMSPLFPEALRPRGQPVEVAIANAMLILDLAMRLHEQPLALAQSVYFVNGRPGFSASYLIARANQCGVFADRIDWEVQGAGDDLAVTAFATLSGSGRLVKATATMRMARAEGWGKNPKYATMPETMLRYRSATALVRYYCPEVLIGGLPAVEELEDGVRDVTPRDVFGLPGHRKPVVHSPAVEFSPKPAPVDEPAPQVEPAARTDEEDAVTEKAMQQQAAAAALEQQAPEPSADASGERHAPASQDQEAPPGMRSSSFDPRRDLSTRAYHAWCEFVADVFEATRVGNLPKIEEFHGKLLTHLREKHPAGYDEAMLMIAQRRAELLAGREPEN